MKNCIKAVKVIEISFLLYTSGLMTNIYKICYYRYNKTKAESLERSLDMRAIDLLRPSKQLVKLHPCHVLLKQVYIVLPSCREYRQVF